MTILKPITCPHCAKFWGYADIRSVREANYVSYNFKCENGCFWTYRESKGIRMGRV